MGVIRAAVRPFHLVNSWAHRVGHVIGVVAIALMVVAILIQVWFRYVLNNALPWPDEAARFCMLWMTGFVAPAAFRRGGFVAIDMVRLALPGRLPQLLSLVLLCFSLAVLVVALRIGWAEVTGFGGRFMTASLWVPVSVDMSEWMRVPRSWMMASLLVGIGLMVLVNIELVLRTLGALLGDEEIARAPGVEAMGGVE